MHNRHMGKNDLLWYRHCLAWSCEKQVSVPEPPVPATREWAEGSVLYSRDLQHKPSTHPCWTVPWEVSTRATFQCPCRLLMSSRAELSHEKAAAADDGFVTTILWSHSCQSVLWMPQRKSLPQVSGRTRGLGLLCVCTV